MAKLHVITHSWEFYAGFARESARGASTTRSPRLKPRNGASEASQGVQMSEPLSCLEWRIMHDSVLELQCSTAAKEVGETETEQRNSILKVQTTTVHLLPGQNQLP